MDKKNVYKVELGLNSKKYKELVLIQIPAGKFLMGSPLDEPGRSTFDSEPPFEVTITRSFWLGKYLVTNMQWLTVMKSSPYAFEERIANHPVTNVSWDDAMSFCDRLNRSMGNKISSEYMFILPTEAQWEYACRAGTHSVYHSGDTLDDLSRVAWHASNSAGRLHDVGELEPNGWGLFDMHGSVVEWCLDFPQSYPAYPVSDWVGLYKNPYAQLRNVRGEAWTANAESSGFRSSVRSEYFQDTGLPYIGFRVCLGSKLMEDD